MATIEQIEEILMEPSERGMRAVGRALVLLYSRHHRGEHKNPMGVSMAAFFLNNGFLTQKHLDFWRRPLQDGTPHILLHKQELLILAELKERRKSIKNHKAPEQVDIKLLNGQKDLQEVVQDVIGAPEKELRMAALLELRRFERQHGLTPATFQGMDDEEAQVSATLEKTPQQLQKEYQSQSNGA